MELALAQRQLLELMCVGFRDRVVEEVTRGLSVEVVTETVQEGMEREVLLDVICRDQMEGFSASVVREFVIEVCR